MFQKNSSFPCIVCQYKSKWSLPHESYEHFTSSSNNKPTFESGVQTWLQRNGIKRQEQTDCGIHLQTKCFRNELLCCFFAIHMVTDTSDPLLKIKKGLKCFQPIQILHGSLTLLKTFVSFKSSANYILNDTSKKFNEATSMPWFQA